MTSWKTYKLGDICDLIAGFAFKSKDFGDNPNKVVKIADIQPPVVSTNDLVGVDMSNYDANKLRKYIVSKGDYVLAMTGATIGKLGRITDDIKAHINQRVLTFRPDESRVDKDYLYYQLNTPFFSKYILNHIDSETAQPNISAGSVGGFEISLPPLEEQRRIAGILGAIDDKIENNRRINTNLELQAQALYKQWFVDNRKDDWEEKQLGEIALHITDGVHNTVIDSPNGEYYLLSCKNIKSGQLFIGSNERRIDHETFTKLRKRTRLSHGDILVTSVGTVGEMYLVNESPSNYEFQRSVAIIKPNNDIISSYFLYAALLYQQNEIKHLAHGAVQQCIFISDLKEYSLIVPNKDDISDFDAVVAPMFNKIGELQKENETLAILRDTLLPKLMNGEIKVAE